MQSVKNGVVSFLSAVAVFMVGFLFGVNYAYHGEPGSTTITVHDTIVTERTVYVPKPVKETITSYDTIYRVLHDTVWLTSVVEDYFVKRYYDDTLRFDGGQVYLSQMVTQNKITLSEYSAVVDSRTVYVKPKPYLIGGSYGVYGFGVDAGYRWGSFVVTGHIGKDLRVGVLYEFGR